MSARAASIGEALAGIAGSPHIIADPARLHAYRVSGKTPAIAVQPGADHEVTEIVRFAAKEKLALIPTGSGSKLSMNISVPRYDLALDVSRMNRVVAYDPGDLTLSVEAGMRLKQLTGVLSEHGQFLPLAVPFEERATIGGTIASGIDSPLRQFYGTARDYVLGMEFVTGEGKLVKSGGRVVKNVSGYDLHKLMIGAFGSLGVITRINLRTFPKPPAMRAFVAFFHSVEEAAQMRHRLAQSPLRPLTVEILNPAALDLLSNNGAAAAETDKSFFDGMGRDGWATAVSFAGNDAVQRRYEGDLHELAGSGDAKWLGESDAISLLSRIREFTSTALEFGEATVIVKISVLPAHMAEMLNAVDGIAANEGVRGAVMARGVGVIYLALLLPEVSGKNCGRATRAAGEIMQACLRLYGNLRVLWWPHDWRSEMHLQQISGGEAELMRKLKNAFDSPGIFAPDPFNLWT